MQTVKLNNGIEMPSLNLLAHSNLPVKLAIFPFLQILLHERNRTGLDLGK